MGEKTEINFNSALIRKFFHTIEYSEEEKIEDLKMEDVLGELASSNDYHEISIGNSWDEVIESEKKEMMIKFADRLDKEIDSIARIERMCRQIPFAYTERSVKFISDSLRYAAYFPFKIGNERIYVLSEKCALSLLAYIFAPIFYSDEFLIVILVVPLKLASTILFIKKVMIELGIPPRVLEIHGSVEDVGNIIKSGRYSDKISFDVFNTDNFEWDSFLSISLPIQVIILEEADLDSACECVLDPWNNPLCINNDNKEVFVQESIYDIVCAKLKERKYEKKVTAFRTLNEAVKQVNNNGQALSVSVWTENIGLANFAAEHLVFGNVWINCFGVYSPTVSFNPRKLNGNGVYGIPPLPFANFPAPSTSEFLKKLAEAKDSQIKWSELSKSQRIDHMRKLLRNPKYKFEPLKLNSFLDSSFSSTSKDYNLNVQLAPLGVLILHHMHISAKSLINTLIEGNSVLICGENDENLEEIADELPAGVLNFCSEPYMILRYVPSDSEKINILPFSGDGSFVTTFSKNVWSTVG